MAKQDYGNYFKSYFSGKGKAVRNRAQKKYRVKLRLKFPEAKSNEEARLMNQASKASPDRHIRD